MNRRGFSKRRTTRKPLYKRKTRKTMKKRTVRRRRR